MHTPAHAEEVCCEFSLDHTEMFLLQFFIKLFVRLAKDSLGYLDWSPYVSQVCVFLGVGVVQA